MSAQLESFLLKTGLITPRELEAAVAEADKAKVPLWDTVTGDNRLSEEVLADTFARWFNLPRVRIASVTIEPEATHKIDDKLARKHTCLPVKVEGKSLLVAVANPLDYQAIQDVEFRSGLGVRPLIATRTEILDGIEVHYATEERIAQFLSNVQDTDELRIISGQREEIDADAAPSRSAAEVPPVVKMCNLILNDAIKLGASDVHVEPGLNDVQVRLRIDGVLRDYTQVPKWLHTPVVSRLKILAQLDISERRLPQDGRINLQYQGKPIDIRVSTLPTHFSEKVVLRVLGTSTIPALDVMGLSAAQVATVSTALSQPQGMIIVTGPTGSGKSTTLYSMIERRKSPEVNIVSVEDPIEYQLAGITQVQVHTKSGLTFASALRSILRQDPDVILVGEVRDAETAEIAFQAAVTGHLVLTTLHTNSSLATVARLLDLGVDPFLLSSSINLLIAQRLARRVCPRCKEPYEPDPEVLERLKVDSQSMVFRRGRGCQMCANTGFAGRTGIFEVLKLTPQLKDLIHHRASEAEMRAAAAAGGTRFLLDEALRKVILGQTTPEEVLRVIRLDDEDQQLNTCPKCLAPIQAAFSTCPYCLHMLKRMCGYCGQELKLDWKACPYCHQKVKAMGPGAAAGVGAVFGDVRGWWPPVGTVGGPVPSPALPGETFGGQGPPSGGADAEAGLGAPGVGLSGTAPPAPRASSAEPAGSGLPPGFIERRRQPRPAPVPAASPSAPPLQPAGALSAPVHAAPAAGPAGPSPAPGRDAAPPRSRRPLRTLPSPEAADSGSELLTGRSRCDTARDPEAWPIRAAAGGGSHPPNAAGNGTGEAPTGLAIETTPHPKRLRILTVDDDPEMRKLLLEALSDLPFEKDVQSASDGDEALRLVGAGIPDLVILDILMPKMDGFEVCRKLRENVRTAFIPIMMLTASADETSRTTGYLLGTDDYVTKPFSVLDLNARVMRLLRRTYGM